MTTSSASRRDLEELHSVIARALKKGIEDSVPGEKGLAALLNVARQFVKDNGIEAVAVPGSPLGDLAGTLPKYPFNPAEESTTRN